MRRVLIATGCFIAALSVAVAAGPGEPSLSTGIDAPLAASETGVPPPEMRLRAIVARALEDSIATWKKLVTADALEVGNVSVRFVTHLGPSNCFGLYSGEGPAYCSGNATVFVGVEEAGRLLSHFGPDGEAGITFLIGHEVGHHIQNIFGRFQLLNFVAARQPWSRTEFQRRFELEADCFAGVWIQASEAWAKSEQFRSEMLAVVGSIGDDSLAGTTDSAKLEKGVHGTSAQRVYWFKRGIESGKLDACDTFAAATP